MVPPVEVRSEEGFLNGRYNVLYAALVFCHYVVNYTHLATRVVSHGF